MSTAIHPTYLHYRLTLRSPAIVATPSGDPNSAATQVFIAGGSIRGAMAARLLAAGVAGDSDDFRRLILSGDFRYLHAYPELCEARALPRPLSWRAEKYDSDLGVDLAAFGGELENGSSDGPGGADWPAKPLAEVRGLFTAATVRDATRSVMTPRIGSRIHQQRDRVQGRPWKDLQDRRYGAIFAYEYLEADQVFRGVIEVLPEAAEEIDRIQELLAARPLLVGRSRRAGYGGEAAIEIVGTSEAEYVGASDAIVDDVAAGSRFRVLLTSAYIGRDASTGQLDPSALERELCDALGGRVTVERRRLAFEIVGSFNCKWRLEVPQALAVSAGTIVVLKATDAISASRFREVEHAGLGERRTEGYGRALFLADSTDQGVFRLDHVEIDGDSSLDAREDRASAQPENRQLERLEQRIILAAAREALSQIATAGIADLPQETIPSNSLLGRLRTLFRGVVDEASAGRALGRLRTWCGADEEPGRSLQAPARKQLERCKLPGNGTLGRWLGLLASATTGEAGWVAIRTAAGSSADRLAIVPRSHHVTSIDAAQAHLHAHAAELAVHLIDSVLAALNRINRRPPQ